MSVASGEKGLPGPRLGRNWEATEPSANGFLCSTNQQIVRNRSYAFVLLSVTK